MWNFLWPLIKSALKSSYCTGLAKNNFSSLFLFLNFCVEVWVHILKNLCFILVILRLIFKMRYFYMLLKNCK